MYRLMLFCVVSLLFIAKTEAQNSKVDSSRELLLKIQHSKPDTGRVSLQLELGSYYLSQRDEFKEDLDSAYYFFTQAEQLSMKLRDINWQYKSQALIGKYYMWAGDQERGKQYIVRLINDYHQKRDIRHEAYTWDWLGDLYEDNQKNYKPEDRINYYQHARSLYIKIHETVKAIGTLSKIARIRTIDKQYDLAENELQQVLNQYNALGYKNLQYTYITLNSLEYAKGDYYRAMAYASEGIRNMKVCGDTSLASLFYQCIARGNYVEKKYDEALLWIRKAVAADKGANEFVYKTAMLQTLIALKRTKEAHEVLKDLSKEEVHLGLAGKLNLYRVSALYYDKIGKNELSAQYNIKILKLVNIKDLGDEYYNIWRMISYNEIAGSYLKINQAGKAKKYIDSASSMFKISKTPLDQRFLEFYYDNAYKYDVATGNYRSAVKNLETHDRLQDSLFNIDKDNKVAELNIQYKIAQREQSIKNLHNQTAIQQAGLEKAKLARNVTIGGIVLVLIIAGLLYRQSRLRRKSNEVITHKNGLLQSLIEEKEWLLKEVHHRVKNNLHTVICLLESQAAYLQNDALEAIEKSQHRIYTMSLIHQKLYQSDDAKTIDMTLYIPELISYLSDSFDVSNRVYFKLKIEPVNLNPAQAIPLALLINEALTNSIKYAFPNGRKGEIVISLTDTGELYKLELTDNGIGLPQKEQMAVDSLGMDLMKGLAKEVRGTIHIENNSGVKITVIFEHDALNDMDILAADYFIAQPGEA